MHSETHMSHDTNIQYLRLFKYELTVHANDLFIEIKFLQTRINVTIKEGSNPNRIDQAIEQNITETKIKTEFT